MRYWIKLYIEILDDPKMGRLTDREYRTCVSLFVLAGKEDRGGKLPSATDMAWSLRMTPLELTADLQALLNLGILTEHEGEWTVRKWQARQAKAPTDAPEEVKARVQEHRERKRNELVTSLHELEKRDGNELVTITKRDTEKNRIDKSREEEEREEISASDDAPLRTPTAQQAMFEAVAVVCQKDGKIRSVAARVGKAATELVKAGYTPEQVIAFGSWWITDRWRAANTPVPTYAQLLDHIKQGAQYQPHGDNHTSDRPDPPSQVRTRELRKARDAQGENAVREA